MKNPGPSDGFIVYDDIGPPSKSPPPTFPTLPKNCSFRVAQGPWHRWDFLLYLKTGEKVRNPDPRTVP